LADFGFASEVTSKGYQISTGVRGTTSYRAPELLQAVPRYNAKIDTWSVGCILYEFATGKKAFANDYATIQYLNSNTLPQIELDDTFSDNCKRIIKMNVERMLQLEPASRPDAGMLLQDVSHYLQSAQFQILIDGNIHRVLQRGARELETRDHPVISVVPETTGSAQRLRSPAEPKEPPDANQLHVYEDIVQKEPLDYWGWHGLCQICFEQNEIDRAIEICEFALKRSPVNMSPIILLSNLYAFVGRYDLAIDASRKLWDVRPSMFDYAFGDLIKSTGVCSGEMDMKGSLEE
jgi:serine/threonine protein kinase